MIVIESTGRVIHNPCTYCFRREQDPEARPGMCWECHVATILMEVEDGSSE